MNHQTDMSVVRGFGFAALLVLTPSMALLLSGCGDEPSGNPVDEPAAGEVQEHEGEHTEEVVLSPESIERWGITLERAERRFLQRRLRLPARVGFDLERVAHVGSVVSGRVGEVLVRVGDEVAAGDALLIVESPELGHAQSDYLRRLSEVESERASLDVAKSLYDRGRELYDQTRAIALSEVQQREAEYKAAEGVLRAAEGAAKAARNALFLLGMDKETVDRLIETGDVNPRYTVRAPIGGRVIEREATLGEAVGPNREALAVVADLSTFWVVADSPEAEAGQVQVGDLAVVRGPAPLVAIEGRVDYITPRLNTRSRTVPIRIEVSGEGMALIPGMFVEAEIRLSARNVESVLAVPDQAVQRVEDRDVVFVPVKDEANTFKALPVSVGEPVEGWVHVTAGLEAGQEVVTNGSFMLKAELGKAGAEHHH